MNHQPFEDMIFEEELDASQELELKQHLTQCEDCRQLQAAMLGVSQNFSQLVSLEPRPGFSNRWEHFAHDRLEHEQQKNAWFLLGGLITVAGGIILANLGPEFFQQINLTQVFVSTIIRSIDMITQLFDAASAIKVVFNVIPRGYIYSIGLVTGAVSLFWIVLWFSMMSKIIGNQRSVR